MVTCTELTQLSEATRCVYQLKIDGYYGYKSKNSTYHSATRCNVDDYEWDIRFYHRSEITLELVFLSQPRANKVTANLGVRLIDPSGSLQPSAKTIDQEALPVPSSNLHQHLVDLLETKAGTDVTFVVSGESFAAHKIVLAARSPVFKAEFFGEMKEKTSTRVQIEEMEATVFKAMLHFIYTDTVPELEEKQETATAMAQHLLVAADRYGLDRLKVICERRIALGIDAGTVATTLTLAEQHGCSKLKAKCLEFILGGSAKNFKTVVETEGFKRLESSNPSMLTELLKAAHKRIKK